MFKKKKKDTKGSKEEPKKGNELRKSSHFKSLLEESSDCISRIVRLFGGVSDEDDELTLEYVITMEDMDKSIKSALSTNAKVEELLVKDTHSTLSDYEALVEQLLRENRLDRFISFHRLRTKIDKINIHIEILRQETFKEAKIEFKDRDIIKDETGKAMWAKNFGLGSFWAPWSSFVNALTSDIGYKLLPDEEKVLKYLLDTAQNDFVNQWKFNEFLKSFGPMKSKFSHCLNMMKSIIREKWFFNFLSKIECENLLYDCEPGTFIVRFSKSVGNFAIAFVGQNKIFHISIKSMYPGFAIYEAASKLEKQYKSIHDVIRAYSYALTIPFWSTMPSEPWFHGEISSQEANELLFGEPPGSFLVRFSSSYPGALAASYMDESLQIKQLLFQRTPTGRWIMSLANEDDSFMTIPELIDSYGNTFKKPLLNPASEVTAGIINKWRQEVIDQDKIVEAIWKPFMGSDH